MKLKTPAEAAQRLKQKTGTLANWRAADKGPPYVKLGRIFYPEDELERWIAERVIRPDDDATAATS